MAETTAPLSLTEQDLLDRRLRELPQDSFAVRLVWLYFRTGIHPLATADPRAHVLHVQDGSHLVWRRPKTRQLMHIPIDPVLRSWISELVAELETRAASSERATPANRAVYYLRLVAQVGKAVGIPGLSPRGLRHTFIARIMRKFRDPNLARQYAGCTIRQAMDYAYVWNEEADRQALRDGF